MTAVLDQAEPLDHAPGVRLHGGIGLAAAALVMLLVFVAANLPSPLYVIYRERFHFSEVVLTLIYAVYMAGSLLAMAMFGRLSDEVGRRPAVLVAIGLSALSTVLFLFTTNVTTLFVARFISGFSIGLVSSACTAWIAELAPDNDEPLAASLATGANLAGLAFGPLLSGLLAQYAPWPLRLSYLVYLAGLVPSALAAWTVKETVRSRRRWRDISMRPRIGVPRELVGQFISPAVTAFVSFSLMGFYSALIPSLLEKSLKIDSHAVAGAITFFLFGCSVATVTATRGLGSRAAMFAGLALMIPGALMVVLAQYQTSMTLLLAASAIGGASVALGYRGSLQVVNEIAPPDRRAGTVAAYLLACYVGVALPVIGIALASAVAGAATADLGFAILLCALTLVAATTGFIYGDREKAARSG